MQFLPSLVNNLAYLNPMPMAGWLVWVGLAGLLTFSLLRWRKYHPHWNMRTWWIASALILATPLTALFLGLEFSNASTLPVPGLPQESGATIMVFSALPWTLAGGLFGPFAGAALGMLSGLIRGVWDTHSLFSIVNLGLISVLFSVSTRQQYRTSFFRVLRQPLFNAVVLTFMYALLFIISALFTVPATTSMSERMDYAFSNAGIASLAFGVEMLVAGFASQILATVFPHHWGRLGSLQPSPAERSIETRFVSGAGAIISILLILLLIGDWIVAGSAARKLLGDRLASAAQISAQGIPFFLETGQSLSTQIASDTMLAQTADSDLSGFLGEQIRVIPFFTQLAVFDIASTSPIASYPPQQPFPLAPPEETGISLALGIQNQVYTIPPIATGETARVSFIVAIPNTTRALVARTDFNSNPYLRPLIENLNDLQSMDGAGILLDEQGTILYHPQSDLIFTAYTGQRSDTPSFFDETAFRGARQLVYYQPVNGHPWAVVLMVPAQEVQQLALNIALPISLLILLLGTIALLALRVSLRAVTGSLENLAAEAKYISTGKLDRPLATEGDDELSELRQAFEQMRISLQARLDDLNRLLVVSQGVASSLTLGDALRPVLEAVIASGASSVRIILLRDMLPIDTPLRFADGLEQNVYMHLDQQIIALTEQQERIVMATLSRTRGLVLDPNLPHPESLIALALRHENKYYGVLWAAYNKQHIFTEADIRFISTLASQSALAVANIRLFMTVEVSRRQLEAILNSTPDPVLVTDASNRLILANPAAGHIFGVTIRRGERPDAEKTIQVKALNELLLASSTERRSAEIAMPDGKTYLAMASPMTADEKTVGRVCILRDVTQLKEIDTLKSDFVATVSHDLRSPLTLMRGYATMLEMAGALNEQQKNYAKMIVQGVDNMAKLVNNLLDLGRIDFGVGLQVESIPVLDILEHVTSGGLQMQAKQKNILLSVEIPKDMPNAIEADQALLHQALYNLVENAIKYTPEGGTVTIQLETSLSSLIFAVQDSGIGISQSDQKRLFEKFYRGTNRDALTQRGTGLGLAIVKSIAERHGGKVWVESTLGQGSVFLLQIPLTQQKTVDS